MTYRVQHSFQHTNGLSQDQFVNTWYFDKIGPTLSDFEAIANIVRSYYTADVPATTDHVGQFMSGIADGAGARVKIFDMNDAQPRPLKYQLEYNPILIGSNATNLPSELAVCLSYAAAPAAGVPASRRRGRLYIGPLNTGAILSPNSSTDATVAIACREVVVGAAAVMSAAATTAGWNWVMHSPTSNQFPEIVRVWCDNAFDIQRRRGLKPSVRSTGII